jgi:serine protease AprX
MESQVRKKMPTFAQKLNIFSMKNFLLTIASLLFFATATAQIYPNKYFISFTDKDNSPYSIDNPHEFLSQRSIDRRVRYGIPVDFYDLPVNPQYLQAVEDIGVELINPTKWLNGVTVFTTDPSKITQIEALPFVNSAFKVAKLEGTRSKARFDEDISLNKPGVMNATLANVDGDLKQSGAIHSLNYGQGFNQIDMINGIPLHDDGFQGQGMLIGVLDAGFTSTDVMGAFDSLYMNGRILGTRDFVSGGENVYHGSSHGTAVLSTMGGNLPGQLVGTAPAASYLLIRTEDVASEYIIEEYNWATGAEYADSIGADVLNTSLGYIGFDDPSQSHQYSHMDGNTTPITIAADRAASRGMVVVNSAGNSGNSSSWPWIGAPADGDSVFSIGAVGANGVRAGFSSIGPTYDGRIKPDVMAQGASTVIASSSGGTSTSSGTSFSSPIIAGMTACLWQTDLSLTNMELIEAIKSSGNSASNPDNFYGWGIPDYVVARLTLSTFDPDLVKNPGDMRIYPNPFDDMVNIVYHSQDTQAISVEVYNIAGINVYSGRSVRLKGGLNHFEVNGLGHLKKGVYLVKVFADNKMSSAKIVKMID